MAWTYDPLILSAASSSTTSLMRVRLMVGDTDLTNPLLTDEEIVWTIGASSGLNYAAANLADNLGARFAFQVNMQNSEVRISAAARSKAYFALADRLRKNGAGDTPGGTSNGTILAEGYFGGTSQEANDTVAADGDAVTADVRQGQDDYFTYERTLSPLGYFKD